MLDSSVKQDEAANTTVAQGRASGTSVQRSGSLVKGKKDGKSSDLGGTNAAGTEAGASQLALHPSKSTKTN